MTFDEFKERLKAHDFYYEYSDDHGVFTRGHSEKRELIRAAQSLPLSDVALAVDECVPEDLQEMWMEIAIGLSLDGDTIGLD